MHVDDTDGEYCQLNSNKIHPNKILITLLIYDKSFIPGLPKAISPYSFDNS